MSATAQIAGPPPLVAVTRVILWAMVIIAFVVAVASLVAGIVGLVGALTSGLTHVTLVADKGASLFNATVASSSTHIVHGEFTTATVVVAALSPRIVALITTASIASTLTEVTLALTVALLAWRMLRRKPFRRSLSLSVSIAGLILVVGGLLSQGATALAGGATAAALNGGGGGYWPLAGRFDPAWTVFGIVLVLVGLAFEYGGRLEKETDGLV